MSVNEQIDHDIMVLHKVVQASDDRICVQLVKHDMEIDSTTEDGTSAFVNAIEKSHVSVEKLLYHNAEVDLSSRDNEAPLIQAYRGHHEIVKHLLKSSNTKTDGATHEAFCVSDCVLCLCCLSHVCTTIQYFIFKLGICQILNSHLRRRNSFRNICFCVNW